MADISIATTRFDSGRYHTTFRGVASEASVTHLFEFSSFAGDATAGNSFSCYVDRIQLDCLSSGSPHILDGSAGNTLVSAGRVSDVTMQFYSQEWDFRVDPLVCLTAADNTSVIVVDMTVVGAYRGSVDYYIGPPPS